MAVRDNWFALILRDALRDGLDRYAIARERERLREMSAAELSDIGLTRQDALNEAKRPFWQGRRC